jgi:uncharacterized membrane protein YjfL (UPF0719 family)
MENVFDAKLLHGVVATVIYGVLGIGLAMLGYKVFDWMTPFDLDEEIHKNKNVAAAVMVSAVVLGVSIIVAAAIAG